MKGFDLEQGFDITETQLRNRWRWKKWQEMAMDVILSESKHFLIIFKSKIWDL